MEVPSVILVFALRDTLLVASVISVANEQSAAIQLNLGLAFLRFVFFLPGVCVFLTCLVLDLNGLNVANSSPLGVFLRVDGGE